MDYQIYNEGHNDPVKSHLKNSNIPGKFIKGFQNANHHILYPPPLFHYQTGYSQYILNILNLSAYLTLITSMSHASEILFVCLVHVLNQYLHEMPLKSE